MKILSAYQLSCNGYMISELGNTKIRLYKEHGTYHLRHVNILGMGEIWECFDSTNGGYTKAIKQFKKLLKIQTGLYELKNYETEFSPTSYKNDFLLKNAALKMKGA